MHIPEYISTVHYTYYESDEKDNIENMAEEKPPVKIFKRVKPNHRKRKNNWEL